MRELTAITRFVLKWLTRDWTPECIGCGTSPRKGKV
jgi:hypothetical protein